MSAPRTAADIDKAWQPTKARTTICLDSDLVLEIERLERQRLREERLDAIDNRAAVAPGIAARIDELREQAKAAEVEFVFQGLGRGAYTDLLRAHPPTPEQETDAGAQLLWNTDTFPPALMAAACVEPTGTDLAWWTRKYDDWGVGQVTRLWQTCMAAQAGVVEVPKAVAASEVTLGSAPSSS
jgi:hypothetical protein